jgi:ABC-2 type transport system permease protein
VNAPATVRSETRPLYWSIRRELWENRSIYLAPLIVAAVYLCGFTFSTIGMPARRRAVLLLDMDQQRTIIAKPYDVGATLLFVVSVIVAIVYCIDALYADRHDRSILFWKSLPVSDRTAVLSKASIPLAVLPLLTFAVVVVLQFAMLLWSSVVLFTSGLAGTTWSRFNLFEQSAIALYGFVIIALWHAPMYGWLLLVSAWARRAAFLWAVLPLISIAIVDTGSGSKRFVTFLWHRFAGGFDRAFVFKPNTVVDSLSQLTPVRFLSTPGLWGGLVFMAACLAVAVRLRRNRERI